MEPKSHNRRRQKQKRDKWRAQGLCMRCGLENDRRPKVYCTLCAAKYAFEHERYRDKRNVSVLKELRLLQERVSQLELAVETNGRVHHRGKASNDQSQVGPKVSRVS